MPDKVPKCIRLERSDCSTARTDFEKHAGPMSASLREVVSEYRNVRYVELSDFLCTADECPPVLYGSALYSDDSHVSYRAATRFAEAYVARNRSQVQN
jgi:hypothetical protein